jgi:hypothetical protein
LLPSWKLQPIWAVDLKVQLHLLGWKLKINRTGPLLQRFMDPLSLYRLTRDKDHISLPSLLLQIVLWTMIMISLPLIFSPFDQTVMEHHGENNARYTTDISFGKEKLERSPTLYQNITPIAPMKFQAMKPSAGGVVVPPWPCYPPQIQKHTNWKITKESTPSFATFGTLQDECIVESLGDKFVGATREPSNATTSLMALGTPLPTSQLRYGLPKLQPKSCMSTNGGEALKTEKSTVSTCVDTKQNSLSATNVLPSLTTRCCTSWRTVLSPIGLNGTESNTFNIFIT